MTKLDVKLKDLQDPKIAELVIGKANDHLEAKMIEKFGVSETNMSFFTSGLRASDPDITDAEINEALERLTQDEIIEISQYAKDRLFNSVLFLSVKGNDGKEVFFAALSRLEDENKISTENWELANAMAKDQAGKYFDAAGMNYDDLNVVYMDESGDGSGGFTPIKVSLDTDLLKK